LRKICASILFASRSRQRTLTALGFAGQLDQTDDAQPFPSAGVAANLDDLGPLWVKLRRAGTTSSRVIRFPT
jgi:hypothetical protein